MPPEVFEILREVVEALAQGLAITIAPHQMILSTGEAADILGVSRPTLVRLLEAGEIPFEQPGRHRRVRLADVLAYRERARGSVRPDWTGWWPSPRTPGSTSCLRRAI